MRIPLSIGDEPSAISIIQESQTDPYKAVAEFVENAIDAGARNCLITRKKSKGQHGLIIRDDGPGFIANDQGIPDFQRVATHICDSIKKRLSEQQRSSVQGQFGIGILGFAAIGRTLQIRSKSSAAEVALFFLERGTAEGEIREGEKDSSFTRGSEVHIWPIHKEVQARLTAPKIAKYLGEELRDRIKQSQINVIVNDPHSKKSIKVVPKQFEGERLRQFDKVKTQSGTNVHFHLYIVNRGEAGAVYLSRGGTKIVDDITALPEFDIDPWDRGLLEGYIEYKGLNISPATRKGILPDDAFTAFVKACRGIEPNLKKTLDDVERKRKETANPELVRKIQKTFREIMKEVGEEYDWFDAPRSGPIPKESPSHGGRKKGYLLSSGPLQEVRILPKIGQVRPHETKRFQARAIDPKGAVIPIGVTYSWTLDELIGTLKPSGNEAVFTAGGLEDQTKLHVSANLHGITAEAEAVVLILEHVNPDSGVSLNLVPNHDPRGSWRSRFLKEIQQLQYNTAHPDYLVVSKKGEGRIFRYIGQLVARHLVLHNFKGQGEEEVMERLLEILAKIERQI